MLTDINLQIQQGEKIALIGASGAGKTTLLNLLLGFETVTEGSIRLNGQALNRENATQTMAYVGQNAYIFYGSITDNIALSNTNATAEQINAAAHAAGVTEFPLVVDTAIAQLCRVRYAYHLPIWLTVNKVITKPFALSLSKGGRLSRSWFDRLTTNGLTLFQIPENFCSSTYHFIALLHTLLYTID